MSEPFERKRYYAWTLDPVHVGTGGYRLGRVDNTITRDPGTFVPKLPGSSIAGVARAYTALAVQSEHPHSPMNKKEKYLRIRIKDGEPVVRKEEQGKNAKSETDRVVYEYDSCAGKGANDGEGHCGAPDCEVCVAFGFSKKNSSFQGLAQFYDAQILFFPLHTMVGPVWITAPSILLALLGHNVTVTADHFRAINVEFKKNLNFGWLMLPPDEPSKAEVDLSFLTTPEVSGLVAPKAFVVPDKLFSQIINDNLEVRTSVAIDPATGAAEDGALFTYEAVPRATLMWFDVIYNDPHFYRIDGEEIRKDPLTPADTVWIKENVEKGMSYFEHLGIGGMGTRGMGRLKVLNIGG